MASRRDSTSSWARTGHGASLNPRSRTRDLTTPAFSAPTLRFRTVRPASLISTDLSTAAASSPLLTAAPPPRSKWATSPSGWAPLVSSPQITRTPVGMMSMMRSRRRRHSWPSTKIDRRLCERSSRPQTTTTPWANLCICSPSAIDGRIARASP